MRKYEELFNQKVKELEEISIDWFKETGGAFTLCQLNSSEKSLKQIGVGNIVDYTFIILDLMDITYSRLNREREMSVEEFVAVIIETFLHMKHGNIEGIEINLGKINKGGTDEQ